MHSSINHLTRGAILAALATTAAHAQFTGPSSSQSPYVLPAGSIGSTTSILTAGDVVDGYKMVGIPDGLGAYDNGNGTFTVLMNHEIPANSGAVRAHGATGAFVSEWVINKADLSVVSGRDLITTVNITSGTTAFNRFCSADLPAPSAFYNGVVGTSERLFLNGEESGAEGRAFAHVATGPNKGVSYELPSLGNFSWENAVANPFAQTKTIVMGTDDSTPGQVYMYVGNKQAGGNEVQQAGLTGGNLYGIKVSGVTAEDRTNGIDGTAGNDDSKTFTLAPLGDVSAKTGAQLQTDSATAGVTEFLRPEDGAWNPLNPSEFYFVTTDRFSNVEAGTGLTQGKSRLWRLSYDDLANPETGGTIDLLLTGDDAGQMFDNITVLSTGELLLQEDVGSNAHLGKTWKYNPTTDSLIALFTHDSNRFITGGGGFLTQDEEASGVIDLSGILGPGKIMFVDQAHYAVAGEQFEGGQLLVADVPEAETYAAGAVVGGFALWQWRRRR